MIISINATHPLLSELIHVINDFDNSINDDMSQHDLMKEIDRLEEDLKHELERIDTALYEDICNA